MSMGMAKGLKLIRLSLFVVMSLLSWSAEAQTSGTADWPVYRHDSALTGTTKAKGKITSPKVKWEYYLGIPPANLVDVAASGRGNLADLDGDGILERYVIDDKTIRIFGLHGEVLWT